MAPSVEPQSLLGPEPIPRPGWPWGPRRGILPPGYQRAGQSVPRSHFPRELPACVDTPLHTRGGQPRIPGQPSRPVRLRVPPGSVPFPSRAGKLFSPPVAEWSREEHRHFTAPRTRTGLCRRGGARTRDPLAPPAPPAHGPVREGGPARPPRRCLFVSGQLGDNWGDSDRLRPATPVSHSAAGVAAG